MTTIPRAIPRAAALAAALTAALAAVTLHGGGEAVAADAAPGAPKLDIPFTKYTLQNGMTVILHQDRSLPLVAVNISVKVGSRHEEPRRTGFAHLFEHLMFMGTKRAPTKMFDAWMEAEGGWNNAFTSSDRTGYYDVGPAHVLPLLLWLEADRFASLPADMNQEKLNAQREVVRNERRQTSENEPYGKVELRLPELMYPEGHPYHHPIIGSHEDLQAATVGDVKTFFGRWYVPNNASLVVAGDFDKAAVEATIERYFGPIPRGLIPVAPAAKEAKLTRLVRETIPDNVQFPKVVMAWHSPARYEPGDAELDLCSVILQEGKASRLYKALVYDKRIAQKVDAYQSSGDLGSQFVVEAIAAPDVTPEKLEEAMDIEIAKIAAEAVKPEELSRAKNQFETAFVTRLQSVVQRASILNQYEAQRGDPGYAERDLQRYRDVTAEALLATAKKTLDPKARVILHVVPKAAPPEAEAPAKKEGAK
ncbi:MAG: insulinase family protein [Polyangiaceae bacterium]|nr:insulinase family protein [Polyangiaceae bacterium]